VNPGRKIARPPASRGALHVRQLLSRSVFEDDPRLYVLNLGPGGELVEDKVAQLIGVAREGYHY
jgi:hypothetical protein